MLLVNKTASILKHKLLKNVPILRLVFSQLAEMEYEFLILIECFKTFQNRVEIA